jgi:membrane peptidoglycan carboxypeptidase
MVSSDNTVYAQLTDLVGPKAIVRTAHTLGIRSRLAPYFSIGLGSAAVSPLEMARAYATIANGGRRVDGSLFDNRPRVVKAVERFRSSRVDVNAPVPKQVMEESHAELLTDILEDVVQSGTGRRAAIPGREVAGKTGTTDNYGDAWFVGYTPELVVAVWVGYPDSLRPMLTEFNGEEVAGGTLPALIWKEFVEHVPKDEERSFDYPPYLGGISQWVVRRGGQWQLDNGYCRGSRLVAYFSGEGPDDEADCKPNEVSVPLVIGMTEAGAEATLAAQPLGAKVVYRPAKAGSLPGLVVDQDPRRGGLSAHDEVTLVVTKARFGLLPNFVGSSLADAQREARRLKVRLVAKTSPGREGTVLRQVPTPGVAIAPGLRVRLVVGDGSRS